MATRARRPAPFRWAMPILGSLLVSGCALVGAVADHALPAAERVAGAPPEADPSTIAGGGSTGAVAQPRPRAASRDPVTSIFRWGPQPASVPEGAVAVSSLPWRLVASMGRVGAQPLWRRDRPAFSPLSRSSAGSLVTPLGPGGPSFAVQAIFVVGGTPLGLAPAWWHATPWLTEGASDPFPAHLGAWFLVEIPLLRLFPHRRVPLFLM